MPKASPALIKGLSAPAAIPLTNSMLLPQRSSLALCSNIFVGFIGAVGEIAAEIVVVVGQALPDAAGVGRIEFDTAGCAVDVIGVFVPCARGVGIVAAFGPVVGIGRMVFVSFPVEPVYGKAVVNVALFFACAVGGVVVEGGVFFVSVS
ncbi:hypothetical protein NEILACOT_05736 [Neisseria lactamica ATCC 23970]|uniref:Uncharacterized protein n=1 Tax=Neisseria lactamica ATCC 23970 TaxID=546265 RepID=D0WDU8_NEILA|nr:hypothetical protein NEILACOT_05736 [Neisseria lactamica ATCC 23970]